MPSTFGTYTWAFQVCISALRVSFLPLRTFKGADISKFSFFWVPCKRGHPTRSLYIGLFCVIVSNISNNALRRLVGSDLVYSSKAFYFEFSS